MKHVNIGLVPSAYHFHQVCICCLAASHTSGHSHTELHRQLADSTVSAAGDSASRCRSRPNEKAGVEAECLSKKSVLSPAQRTTYLGIIMTSVSCTYRFDSVSENVTETVRSDGSCIHLYIHFGLLYMIPLQWWLRTKGFSLWGNPLCMIKVMWQCLHAFRVGYRELVPIQNRFSFLKGTRNHLKFLAFVLKAVLMRRMGTALGADACYLININYIKPLFSHATKLTHLTVKCALAVLFEKGDNALQKKIAPNSTSLLVCERVCP